MQKFFAVAALLLSMTSMVVAAPVAIPEAKGITPTGINNYGNDGRASTVNQKTGEIEEFDAQTVSDQAAVVQAGKA